MKTVTIVGVGALGSHVMLFARNWKVGFHLIDFDKVEQKNTQAQFHSRMGLRQNKAQALAKGLLGLYGLKVRATTHKVTTDNVEALLGNSALVIDCTDNIAARKVIQDFCKPNDIPCLHGCLSGGGDFARIVWTDAFVADPEGEEGEATCEDGEQLPFFGMAGGLIAAVAQEFLETGNKRNRMINTGALLKL